MSGGCSNCDTYGEPAASETGDPDPGPTWLRNKITELEARNLERRNDPRKAPTDEERCVCGHPKDEHSVLRGRCHNDGCVCHNYCGVVPRDP